MQTQPQSMNFLSQNYPVLSCSKETNKDRTEIWIFNKGPRQACQE